MGGGEKGFEDFKNYVDFTQGIFLQEHFIFLTEENNFKKNFNLTTTVAGPQHTREFIFYSQSCSIVVILSNI